MLTVVIIAISLSMDAFSLALIYGTQNISNKHKLLLALIVGIYHFIMPLLGLLLGEYIDKRIILSSDLLVGIILFLIAIQMIVSSFKDEDEKSFNLSITSYLVFGLSVSIDSFTTGIGLPSINRNYLIVSLIFSFTSFLFTYMGVNLGNVLNRRYGKISTLVGGSILLIIALSYLL